MEYALTRDLYQKLSDCWVVSAPVISYSKRFVDLKGGCFIHQVSQVHC